MIPRQRRPQLCRNFGVDRQTRIHPEHFRADMPGHRLDYQTRHRYHPCAGPAHPCWIGTQ